MFFKSDCRKKVGTVKALEDSKCLKLNVNDYQYVFFQAKRMMKKISLELLQKIPFFSKWNSIKLQGFNQELQEIVFKKNQNIFDTNDNAEFFYIIKSGRIKREVVIEFELTNKYPVSTRKWELIKTQKKILHFLNCYGPEEYFGFDELLAEEDKKRGTKLTAIEETVLLYMSKQEFLTFLDKADREELKSKILLVDPKKISEDLMGSMKQEKLLQNAFLDGVNMNMHPITRNMLTETKKEKIMPWFMNIKERSFSEHKKTNKILETKIDKTVIERRKKEKYDCFATCSDLVFGNKITYR